MLKRNSVLPISFLTAVILALPACGGGGSSSAPAAATATPTAATGTVSMSLTDGPGSDFDHVWVTVKAISFHSDPDAVWSKKDATWHTTTLDKPVTIDLAALNNGALSDALASMKLPVGTYRQIRLFFAGADESLTDSAVKTFDNETPAAALQWNDQVEYTDASGAILESPLEVAYPTQGIQLNGTFNVTENSTLNLVVDFDLEHDVVPFKHGALTAFVLKPNLHYFDLTQAGAIVGQVDTSKLCSVDGRGIPNAVASCAYNLIAKAELISADGSRHYDARATSVNPRTGKFILYPVPTKDLNGNTLSYDVLVRGRQMDTLLVTGITPIAGGTPSSKYTAVQTAQIPITVDTHEYQAQFSAKLDPLTSGYAIFQQTITSGGAPYEVRWGNTDPYTGKLVKPIWLQNGPVQVASFNAGDTLSFTSTTPIEGTNDSYRVGTNELAYYKLTNSSTPVTATLNSFVPPSPVLANGIENGVINVNLTLANLAGTYDKGILVLSRFANIVTTEDVSSLLASGGAIALDGVPSGSASNKVPGAYYYAYLRVWNSAHPFKTLKTIPVPQMIDLRTASSTTVNVSLDGSNPVEGL